MGDTDLVHVIERIERLEIRSSRFDELLRGDGGDEPGLASRVRSLEELAGSIKQLARWAAFGALSAWGALIWSMVQAFLATKGVP